MLMAKRAPFAQFFWNFFSIFFRNNARRLRRKMRKQQRIGRRRKLDEIRRIGKAAVGEARRFGRKKTLGDFSSSVSALPC